jgi:hypothetical protein
MILRRIKAHIEKENWFAVGIDFCIVVIGVFIGIQVANWNEVRGDRADEVKFFEQLHPDLERVETSSARLRERRSHLLPYLRSAASKIFSDEYSGELSEIECFAISVSHYYNINVLGLPSWIELTNSGRVDIIRDETLRSALVDYQMSVDNLSEIIRLLTLQVNNLVMLEPNLVRLQPVLDPKLGEMQTTSHCDVEGMRGSQSFRNALSENIDSYDAYLRDGIQPWIKQFQTVRGLVVQALDLPQKEAVQ